MLSHCDVIKTRSKHSSSLYTFSCCWWCNCVKHGVLRSEDPRWNSRVIRAVNYSEFYARSQKAELTGVSKKALIGLSLSALSSEPRYQSSHSSFSRAPEDALTRTINLSLSSCSLENLVFLHSAAAEFSGLFTVLYPLRSVKSV